MYDPLCGILYNGWLIKAVLCTIISVGFNTMAG